jgi:hypothetical protein
LPDPQPVSKGTTMLPSARGLEGKRVPNDLEAYFGARKAA